MYKAKAHNPIITEFDALVMDIFQLYLEEERAMDTKGN
jgi:hypothetical protein